MFLKRSANGLTARLWVPALSGDDVQRGDARWTPGLQRWRCAQEVGRCTTMSLG